MRVRFHSRFIVSDTFWMSMNIRKKIFRGRDKLHNSFLKITF